MPQATHHPCHRPVWEESVQNTQVFLGNLSRRQTTERTRLQHQLARAERVLGEIDSGIDRGIDTSGQDDAS